MKYFAALIFTAGLMSPGFAQNAPKGHELTLYSSTQLKGQKRVITETTPNLDGANADNFAWSLSTKGKWEVCMDAGHRAGCRVLSGDIRDLGTDGGAITSVRYISHPAIGSTISPATENEGSNYLGYVYTTDFNDLTITAWHADQVKGRYEYAGGRIEGELNGDILTGYWLQEESPLNCGQQRNGTPHWGRFTFTFNADRTAFSGEWSDCGETPSKPWNGTLIRRRAANGEPSFQYSTYSAQPTRPANWDRIADRAAYAAERELGHRMDDLVSQTVSGILAN